MSDEQGTQGNQNEAVRDKAAINPEASFSRVRQLLAGPGAITKALPGSQEALLQLRDHAYFEERRFTQTRGAVSRVEGLLDLERELMIEIERCEAVERALSAGVAGSALQEKLKALTSEAEAAFDGLLTEVKVKDRELETAVRSFDAFLREARVSADPNMSQTIYVLNVDPQQLARATDFGAREQFGPIEGLGMVHANVFGMWVLGTKIIHADQAADIGAKALKHTATAIMNVDSEQQIDRARRRDPVGERARGVDNTPRTAAEARAKILKRTPLTGDDVSWVAGCCDAREGMERVVLCFSPIRVRAETRFDGGNGDVTIPSAYVLGGKIFNVAMVSKKESIATLPSQVEKQYGIGSYAVTGSTADYGPFLFDFEGARDVIERWPVVAGFVTTGYASETEMQQSINHFDGKYTAAGKKPDNQIPTVLAYDYLRRIMTVLGRGIEGKPKANRGKIVASVQALLQKTLMGADARMPFTSIKVRDDQTSAEGKEINAVGGIRLIVEVTAKTAIPEVAVAIMPSDKS